MTYTLDDYKVVERASQNHDYNIIIDSQKYNVFRVIHDVTEEHASEIINTYGDRQTTLKAFIKSNRTYGRQISSNDTTASYVIYSSIDMKEIITYAGNGLVTGTLDKKKYLKLNVNGKDKANHFIKNLTRLYGKDIIKKVYFMNIELRNAVSENFTYKVRYSYTKPTRFSYFLKADMPDTLDYMIDTATDILKDTKITLVRSYGEYGVYLDNIHYKDLDSLIYLSNISSMQGKIALTMDSATVNLSDSTIESIDKIKQLNQLQIR